MHNVQHQTHTLTANNQALKSVIRDMQHELIHQEKLYKTTLLFHRSLSPTSPPLSRREGRRDDWDRDGQRTTTSESTPGCTRQQHAQTSATPPKPAVRTAATTTPQRTTQDSRRAATSGHVDSTSPFTAPSPCQRLADLRIAQGVINVLTGDSVSHPIKPDLVFPGGQNQNISISGLAIDDVNHWLANIPWNREVRCVHVCRGHEEHVKS